RAGDDALREFGERVRKLIPENATLARLGGDEFGALLPETGGREDIAKKIREIHAELAKPFRSGENEISLATSAGWVLAPEDGVDAAVLWEKADQAMYQEKAHRKNA